MQVESDKLFCQIFISLNPFLFFLLRTVDLCGVVHKKNYITNMH